MPLASPLKLPPLVQKYYDAHCEHWQSGWRKFVRRYLRQFEERCREQGIEPHEIQLSDVTDYAHACISQKSRERRFGIVRAYLIWCARHYPACAPAPHKLFPEFMEGSRRILPPIAEQYLAMRLPGWKYQETSFRVRRALWQLHGWLVARDLRLADLSRDRLVAFLSGLEGIESYRQLYLRRSIGQYLHWLSEHSEIPPFQLAGVVPVPWYQRKKTISAGGIAYLNFLPAVVKEGTKRCHQTGVSRFFSFLQKNGVEEKGLNRTHIDLWLRSLADDGLAASTRHHYIQKVRHYLHWQYDRGELKMAPERLLSAADLPKKPRLLPRPYPPDIDAEIQRRLKNSGKLMDQAILLLRHTGIRSNELWLLPDHCVQEDHAGNSFLKVPVGKMNSERLVPLDAETLALIANIRLLSMAARRDSDPKSDAPLRLVQGPVKNPAFYYILKTEFLSITQGLSSTESMELHRLRHTYATELLSAGMSLYGVMNILGHRTITTTLVYASVVRLAYEQFLCQL